MVFRFDRRSFVIALGGMLLGGCLAKSLPLPPPGQPFVSAPDELGFATVQGKMPDETTAFVQNLENGLYVGQDTEPDGRYLLKIEASVGDVLVVYYEDGFERSPTVREVVPAEDEALPSVTITEADPSE
ncbi:MAG: hypothetical protein MK135_03475 [Polyangiaceae bacterium]|nr:hypothetical protein [Polyangiaceae bacterium]